MDFFELAKKRYSVRKYKNNPVEEEKIEKIIEAGRLAPTACNYQPQKVYVVKSAESRKKLSQITPCTFDAPVIFMIGYDDAIAAKGSRREDDCLGETDAAIVCAHMMFEAADLGLGSCWVGRFTSRDIINAFNLPDNIHICNLLPVGYEADDFQPSQMHFTFRDKDETVEMF